MTFSVYGRLYYYIIIIIIIIINIIIRLRVVVSCSSLFCESGQQPVVKGLTESCTVTLTIMLFFLFISFFYYCYYYYYYYYFLCRYSILSLYNFHHHKIIDVFCLFCQINPGSFKKYVCSDRGKGWCGGGDILKAHENVQGEGREVYVRYKK